MRPVGWISFINSSYCSSPSKADWRKPIKFWIFTGGSSSSDSLSMIGGPSRTRIGKGLAKKREGFFSNCQLGVITWLVCRGNGRIYDAVVGWGGFSQLPSLLADLLYPSGLLVVGFQTSMKWNGNPENSWLEHSQSHPIERQKSCTLPETNQIRTWKWMGKEDDPFLLGVCLFSGALAVSFREWKKQTSMTLGGTAVVIPPCWPQVVLANLAGNSCQTTTSESRNKQF